MKKMLWMAAVLAVALTPVLASAAEGEGESPMAVWKAKRGALMKEARELQLALNKAKMAAKKDNADVKALAKDMRAARMEVRKAEKADGNTSPVCNGLNG